MKIFLLLNISLISIKILNSIELIKGLENNSKIILSRIFLNFKTKRKQLVNNERNYFKFITHINLLIIKYLKEKNLDY